MRRQRESFRPLELCDARVRQESDRGTLLTWKEYQSWRRRPEVSEPNRINDR